MATDSKLAEEGIDVEKSQKEIDEEIKKKKERQVCSPNINL